MWKSVTNFFRRHRRKFFITGGVIGAIILIQRYVRYRVSLWEVKQTQELIEQMKRKHHFEGILQTCDSTIMSLICRIRESVLNLVNSKELVQQLKNNPPNKVEIWDDLKILVFTEIIAEIYCTCLFAVVFRIQMCVIGGYMYLDSENSKNVGANIIVPPKLQQKYLSHVHHFLNSGIREIIPHIKNATESAVRSISLKHTLMLKDFQIIFDNIKQSLCSEKHVLSANSYYVLPDTCNEREYWNNLSSAEHSVLVQITNETKDLIESKDFSVVLSDCLERGFAVLMDRLSECYVLLNQEKDSFKNPHSVAIPMAKVIPTIYQVIQQQKPDEQGSLASLLLHSALLTDFSANIYETFSHTFNEKN